MAIIVGELTGSRKKLGATVYQKGRDGKTIARRYVVPKNPQTAPQMAQRILFGTITQASKFMKAVIDHSFEGVSKGAKSVNHFCKLNVPVLRAAAAHDFDEKPVAKDCTVFVTTKGVTALIPNKYCISDGSLSAPRLAVKLGDNNKLNLVGGSLPATAVTKVTVEGDDFYGLTLGEIIRGIFGLSETNEQLTLCAIARSAEEYMYSYNGESSEGYQIPYTSFNARRLVFNPAADLSQVVVLLNDDGTENEHANDNLEAAVMSAFSSVDTDDVLKAEIGSMLQNATLTITGSDESDWAVALAPADYALDQDYIYDVENALGHVYAAGIIRSKQVDGKWRRSRSFMVLADVTTTDNYGLIWAIANPAWFRSDIIAESSLFLNEGGSRNEVGENF